MEILLLRKHRRRADEWLIVFAVCIRQRATGFELMQNEKEKKSINAIERGQRLVGDEPCLHYIDAWFISSDYPCNVKDVAVVCMNFQSISQSNSEHKHPMLLFRYEIYRKMYSATEKNEELPLE